VYFMKVCAVFFGEKELNRKRKRNEKEIGK
jgi:hypothetical protein